MSDRPDNTRHIWRNALALISGIVTGTVLASAEPMWHLIGQWFHKEPIETGTYFFWVLMYVGPPLTAGTVIALIASLIWWCCGANLRLYLGSAVALGFVAAGGALVMWCVLQNAHHWLDPEVLPSVFVYGLMGAVAGAVTWFISHPQRKNLFTALE